MFAVEAFVELMSCTVFSVLDYVFSFFFQIIFALNILTSYWNDTSWSRHNIVQIRSTILTNLNWDTAKNLAKILEFEMKNLNFDEVWAFIKKYALPQDLGDSLFIPDKSEWKALKEQFLSVESNKDRSKIYKRYAELMAEFPRAIEKINGVKDLLDEDLFDIGVFVPKKELIHEVYDPRVGLDKWVEKL